MTLTRYPPKMVLLAIVFAAAIFGETPSGDDEQELNHVWTPEPELATAIACLDNVYGEEHPDDPNRQQPVPLPAPVRAVICDLTLRTFAKELYEGPTQYADLFGPVHRLTILDNPDLHLYVYRLKRHPELSFRYYSFNLILHDVRTKAVSPVVLQAETDFQNYCPAPWIRFQDVSGDEAMEILLLTGYHNGTSPDEVELHVLCVEGDLELREVLVLRTAIRMDYAWPGETWEEQRGYVVRTIEKVGPDCAHVMVSLSKDKMEEGESILGYEVWKTTGETGRMHKAAVNKIVEKDYRDVFRERP